MSSNFLISLGSTFCALVIIGLQKFFVNEKQLEVDSVGVSLPTVSKRLVIEQTWGYAVIELNVQGEPLVVTGIFAFSEQPIALDVAVLSELMGQPFSLVSVLMALNDGSQPSRLICSCFRVTDQQIIHAVEKEGVGSLCQLQKQLKCGTNCGSCLPEVEQQLDLLIASVTPRSQ